MRASLLARLRQDVVGAAMLDCDATRLEAFLAKRLERGAPGVVPAERREVGHARHCPRTLRRERARDRRRSSARRTRTRRRGVAQGSARCPPRSISSPISSEGGACRERREREDRRAPERLAEGDRELSVRDRVRGREVHGAGEIAAESEGVRGHDVVQADPRHHCLPLPTRPPRPSLNGGSMRSSAPPSFARTIPWRRLTTRMPASRAGSAAASQARTTSARNPLPAPTPR